MFQAQAKIQAQATFNIERADIRPVHLSFDQSRTCCDLKPAWSS